MRIKLLMKLNESNQNMFEPLVKQLQKEAGKSRPDSPTKRLISNKNNGFLPMTCVSRCTNEFTK